MTTVAGNVYGKYTTRNPIERRLVGGFLCDLGALVDRSGASEAHEVGCGEGELAVLLAKRGLKVRGCDIDQGVVDEARERAQAEGLEIEFRQAAVEELDPEADAAELVVCCEVLEHVERPLEALRTLTAMASPWLITSVPREPLWRALNLSRGKYVADAGNTPGHLNHWSRAAFVEMLSERLDVIEVRSPLPWSMALCRRRSP